MYVYMQVSLPVVCIFNLRHKNSLKGTDPRWPWRWLRKHIPKTIIMNDSWKRRWPAFIAHQDWFLPQPTFTFTFTFSKIMTTTFFLVHECICLVTNNCHDFLGWQQWWLWRICYELVCLVANWFHGLHGWWLQGWRLLRHKWLITFIIVFVIFSSTAWMLGT